MHFPKNSLCMGATALISLALVDARALNRTSTTISTQPSTFSTDPPPSIVTTIANTNLPEPTYSANSGFLPFEPSDPPEDIEARIDAILEFEHISALLEKGDYSALVRAPELVELFNSTRPVNSTRPGNSSKPGEGVVGSPPKQPLGPPPKEPEEEPKKPKDPPHAPDEPPKKPGDPPHVPDEPPKKPDNPPDDPSHHLYNGPGGHAGEMVDCLVSYGHRNDWEGTMCAGKGWYRGNHIFPSPKSCMNRCFSSLLAAILEGKEKKKCVKRNFFSSCWTGYH
ncbi:hypothetical protein BX600DRAFT_454395 [Xylariales sp. PMI_506]|nr:hypothetical protein BX600DRAFT_454395 [Xylariales sp. PMI_506]